MDNLNEQAPFTLNPKQLRVLGVLIEKELTTPDNTPLSLNALKNGCNQSTNRDPIVDYNEETIEITLDQLLQDKWVWDSRLGRVRKYAQNMGKRLNLVARETIVLALLFLRGPQTVGELRGRSGRAYAFKDLNEVQETLNDLMEWGHLRQLPRQAGRKEPRYVHCFSEPEDGNEAAASDERPATTNRTPQTAQKIEALESALTQLQAEHEALKKDFQAFKAQF